MTQTLSDDLAGRAEPLAGLSERAHQASDLAQHLVAEVKPRLRGLLHAAIAPVTLVAGLVLVMTSAPGAPRLGSAVFAGSALTLFSVSAALHRGHWTPRANRLLRRLDHACIFLLIAGTCTPFSLLLLEGTQQVVMLVVAWGGALLGATFRLVWTDAPRRLYTPVYLAVGWASVFFVRDFLAHGGLTAVALIVAGGLLYTIGGVVYALRRPDPFPSWFGFHEVFHTFTVVAFAAHYAGVVVITQSLR
jgi:hemolysin III